MPLFDATCHRNHTRTDLLKPDDPHPACTETLIRDGRDTPCGLPMMRQLSAPSRVGPAGKHEGQTRTERPPAGYAVETETETTRVRQKGGGELRAVESKWRCPCGFNTFRCDEEKPVAVACEKCGRETTEVQIGRIPDWFAEKMGSGTRYFDEGMGIWITSRRQRDAEMAARGLICVADVGEMGDRFEREQCEQARDEDETVREMLRDDFHGKHKEDTRKRLDDGRTGKELDPRGFMRDLGMSE